MKQRKDFCLAIYVTFGLALGAVLANAQVVYTCDSNVAASTCTYLNSTVAGYYKTTFSNANASIYIRYGTTGLGSSLQYLNYMTYNQYVAALNANTSKSSVQTAALSALNTYDATPYGNGKVEVTSALGTVLGQTGMTGIKSDASTACTIGTSGCYNAIITITNDSNTLLYYDDQGGTEPWNAYDFYGTVQHETDEVLGTSSCIGTSGIGTAHISVESVADGQPRPVERVMRATGGASLAVTSAGTATLRDNCGDGVPSAVDLYRYSGKRKLVLDSELSTKAGAYFSYDGGDTKGAVGVDGAAKDYNTEANGADYADFVSSADCATKEAIQDAFGCNGQDAGLTILNDGQGEINILNAVGYNLVSASAQLVNPNKKLLFFGQVIYSPTASSKEDGLDLKNDGSTAANIGPITIAAAYGNVNQFSFESKCPDFLDPGKNCRIKVTFTPNSAGISRATLKIPTSPGNTISIPLTGNGIVDPNQ